MARRHDILRALGCVDGDRDGARAVGGGNASGHAFLRFDRDGEGRLHAFGMIAAHRLEPERVDPRPLHGEANQPAAVGRHEVDSGGGGHLAGNDEIALVFAVFVVDQDIHPPVARFIDDFLDPDQNGAVVVVVEETRKLRQRIRGWVPAILQAGLQRIGMQPRRPRQPTPAHLSALDDLADTVDHGAHVIADNTFRWLQKSIYSHFRYFERDFGAKNAAN